ncbi:MAG: zinc ribbon domain-containing protein [Parabacteroides sp.]|nr:zinc ribbon domain-containing protein [Parabacteroides sp.]MDY4846890.1 zinc ribbon domain-containing protein [Parabacteroides sp.]
MVEPPMYDWNNTQCYSGLIRILHEMSLPFIKNGELKLSERTYRCEKCGMVLDRDYNASLNLLNWAHEKLLPAFSVNP